MERMDMVDQLDRSEKNIGTAEYYIQQLNVNNAKKVALCLVLGFICYHGLIHLRYGICVATTFIIDESLQCRVCFDLFFD